MTATHPAVIRHTSRRGLRYGHDGTGPAVVLVHGWCLNRQVWMYLEQALVAGGRTVITPDLAGYGESASLAPRTSLADHAADLTDLLDELDVDRAVLVGFAFGAAVILSAEDYQRVGALVSVAIPSAGTAPYDRMQGAILKDWPRFAVRSAQAIVPEQVSTETRDWLARMYGATNLPAALAGLDILRSFEPADLVKRWEVPAYFVHGSGDPIVPAKVSQECAQRFGGQYVEVPSQAHLVVIDQKEAVYKIVEDVVEAVLGTKSMHLPRSAARSRHFYTSYLVGPIIVEALAYVVDLGNWGCPKFPRKPDLPRKWDAWDWRECSDSGTTPGPARAGWRVMTARSG